MLASFKNTGSKADILADKQTKLIGRDLAQTFKAGYLGLVAQFGNGVAPLFIAIAINGFLFITHPEQRRLQDGHVPGFHQIREKLQKEGHQQQANVHTIHIGIGSYYNIVIAQVINTILNIQRVLQQVKFLVLVNHFFGEAETVQRLTL
jgi:hypothetical protein